MYQNYLSGNTSNYLSGSTPSCHYSPSFPVAHPLLTHPYLKGLHKKIQPEEIYIFTEKDTNFSYVKGRFNSKQMLCGFGHYIDKKLKEEKIGIFKDNILTSGIKIYDDKTCEIGKFEVRCGKDVLHGDDCQKIDSNGVTYVGKFNFGVFEHGLQLNKDGSIEYCNFTSRHCSITRFKNIAEYKKKLKSTKGTGFLKRFFEFFSRKNKITILQHS